MSSLDEFGENPEDHQNCRWLRNRLKTDLRSQNLHFSSPTSKHAAWFSYPPNLSPDHRQLSLILSTYIKWIKMMRSSNLFRVNAALKMVMQHWKTIMWKKHTWTEVRLYNLSDLGTKQSYFFHLGHSDNDNIIILWIFWTSSICTVGWLFDAFIFLSSWY